MLKKRLLIFVMGIEKSFHDVCKFAILTSVASIGLGGCRPESISASELFSPEVDGLRVSCGDNFWDVMGQDVEPRYKPQDGSFKEALFYAAQNPDLYPWRQCAGQLPQSDSITVSDDFIMGLDFMDDQDDWGGVSYLNAMFYINGSMTIYSDEFGWLSKDFDSASYDFDAGYAICDDGTFWGESTIWWGLDYNIVFLAEFREAKDGECYQYAGDGGTPNQVMDLYLGLGSIQYAEDTPDPQTPSFYLDYLYYESRDSQDVTAFGITGIDPVVEFVAGRDE